MCLWRLCLILYILYQTNVITAKVRRKKIHQSHANRESYVAYALTKPWIIVISLDLLLRDVCLLSLLLLFCSSNHEDEMDEACGTYDKRKIKARRNVWGKLKGKGRFEGLDVDGKTVFKLF